MLFRSIPYMSVFRRHQGVNENEIKVVFDEQTKFHWNNISIIATVLGAIMLHTQQQ